ncbi:hypothetical protein LSH36_461g01002 [Paralvinella palmiformis]|uniref:Uncharacterized protein n=1 Tax=Paralvinella palmiformis TaxID=53620 RepID=A0AAD9JAY6_9ANNE|nr:hypothetical protein LSH36_461g01002 [Paralvinella palmiformis]
MTRQHLSKEASGVVCSHMVVKFAEHSMCICSWLENVRVDARIDSIPLLTIAWGGQLLCACDVSYRVLLVKLMYH